MTDLSIHIKDLPTLQAWLEDIQQRNIRNASANALAIEKFATKVESSSVPHSAKVQASLHGQEEKVTKAWSTYSKPTLRAHNLQGVYVDVNPTPKMRALMRVHAQDWINTFKRDDPQFTPRAFLETVYKAIQHFPESWRKSIIEDCADTLQVRNSTVDTLYLSNIRSFQYMDNKLCLAHAKAIAKNTDNKQAPAHMAFYAERGHTPDIANAVQRYLTPLGHTPVYEISMFDRGQKSNAWINIALRLYATYPEILKENAVAFGRAFLFHLQENISVMSNTKDTYIENALDAGVGKLFQEWLKTPGNRAVMWHTLQAHEKDNNADILLWHVGQLLGYPDDPKLAYTTLGYFNDTTYNLDDISGIAQQLDSSVGLKEQHAFLSNWNKSYSPEDAYHLG